jgi:hypothetical protein
MNTVPSRREKAPFHLSTVLKYSEESRDCRWLKAAANKMFYHSVVETHVQSGRYKCRFLPMYRFKASEVSDNGQKCSYKILQFYGVWVSLVEKCNKTFKTLVKTLCRGSRCMWNAEGYKQFWPPHLCTVECMSKLNIVTKVKKKTYKYTNNCT